RRGTATAALPRRRAPVPDATPLRDLAQGPARRSSAPQASRNCPVWTRCGRGPERAAGQTPAHRLISNSQIKGTLSRTKSNQNCCARELAEPAIGTNKQVAV